MAAAKADPKRKLPTGIVARHSRACLTRNGGTCRLAECKPTFRAWVYDARSHQKIAKAFPTLAAAKRWRTDALSDVQRGKLAPPSKRTLRDAWESWYSGATSSPPTVRSRSGTPYKPSVLRGYAADMRIYVLGDLGALRLSEVRRRDLQGVIDRLLGKGLSPSKIRNVVMPLRALYRHALQRDEVDVNPTANLHLPSGLGVRDRVASVDEAEALFVALPESDRALWATAFYAGLRLGELQALRHEDVDLDQSVIHVRHGWDAKEGEIEPKSRKSKRDVPIMGALDGYLRAHQDGTGRGGHDLFFGATASRAFTPSHMRNRALGSWAATAVGSFLTGRPVPFYLAPIGFHELRHSCVTFMHEAGLSLEDIGDLVGHSSTYMSDRYRHLRDDRRDHHSAKLEAYRALAYTGGRIKQLVEDA
jgi:integrase